MKRRVHSSIDRLPALLREQLREMIVDNLWPADFGEHYDGHPRHDDCVAYAKAKGSEISHSAVGRWARYLRTIARMKEAGLLARETMAGLTDEDAPKTQKAAAEMLTALLLEFMADHEKFKSKDLKEVGQAIRDCAQVTIKADGYIRQQVINRIEKASASAKQKLSKAGVDLKVAQEIIDEYLGVTKS